MVAGSTLRGQDRVQSVPSSSAPPFIRSLELVISDSEIKVNIFVLMVIIIFCEFPLKYQYIKL
jgi:hypothetical protein